LKVIHCWLEVGGGGEGKERFSLDIRWMCWNWDQQWEVGYGLSDG